MRIRTAALTIAALLALALPALAQTKVPGVTDSEVVLGITTPLSGPAAAWGTTGPGGGGAGGRGAPGRAGWHLRAGAPPGPARAPSGRCAPARGRPAPPRPPRPTRAPRRPGAAATPPPPRGR